MKYGFIVQNQSSIGAPAINDRVIQFAEDNKDLLRGSWVVDMTGAGSLFAKLVAKAGGRVEAIYHGPEVRKDQTEDGVFKSGVYVRPSFESGGAHVTTSTWKRVVDRLDVIYVLQTKKDHEAGIRELLVHAAAKGAGVQFIVPAGIADPPPVRWEIPLAEYTVLYGRHGRPIGVDFETRGLM